MIYKGKVDWWIGLAILFGIVVPAWSAINKHQWSTLAIPGLFAAFVLVTSFPQSYESMADTLRIRHGLMTKSIPWPSITRLSPSPVSRGPIAMSLRIVRNFPNVVWILSLR